MWSTKEISVIQICFILFVFFCIKSAFGQFSVVSTSPGHGDVGVDTAATFSVTFNSAIDTSARFAFPPGLFISIGFSPDTLVSQPDSVTISPDFKTAFFHNLSLSLNTTYLFVIVNAVSQLGDSLDSPFSFVFTTSDSLPSGSVSGTISYPGNQPTGALVGLLNGPLFGDDDSDAFIGAVVPGVNGDYTVDFVDSGTYWPVAIKDFFIDDSGEFQFEAGSALGYYDINNDLRPDSIEVPPNGQISGIDFPMSTIFLQSARGPFPAIETIAQNWAADAQAVSLGGQPQPDGLGLFWQYVFYSSSALQHRAWFSWGNVVAELTVAVPASDTLLLPQNWLDSDTILIIAESNGGQDFRLNNPETNIFTFLGFFNFAEHQKNDEVKNFPLPQKQSLLGNPLPQLTKLTAPDFSSGNNNQVLQFPPVWAVQYFSDSTGNGMQIIIEAESGAVLKATAANAEQQAFIEAQNWAADARLSAAVSQGNNIDPLGKTDFWNCIYYSPSLDSTRFVLVLGEIPIAESSLGGMLLDTVATGWLDSDVTIAVAEALGGAAYRSTNQNATASAFLSRWFFGTNPQLTIWRFQYTSSTADTLDFIIDAISGTVVGIEQMEEGALPDKFSLQQNFPNPFNPLTNIRFKIPRAIKVELVVYNLLGQKVAVLVDKKLPGGSYNLFWNPRTLSSGIYMLSLKAGDFHAARKMTYIK